MAATQQFEIVHEVLDLAGARWTVDVLSVLRSGRLRFNEIAREVDGISQKQLTHTLRTLQRDGRPGDRGVQLGPAEPAGGIDQRDMDQRGIDQCGAFRTLLRVRAE